MWAARMCVLSADKKVGEELTDAILDEEEVQAALRRVYRYPQDHDEELGKPPPLKRWLRCDPRDHIFEID